MQRYNESYNVTRPIKEHNHNATWIWTNALIQLNITIMQHDHGPMSQSNLTLNENCNPTYLFINVEYEQTIK